MKLHSEHQTSTIPTAVVRLQDATIKQEILAINNEIAKIRTEMEWVAEARSRGL